MDAMSCMITQENRQPVPWQALGWLQTVMYSCCLGGGARPNVVCCSFYFDQVGDW
jgi:hypothetical protein